MPFDFHLRQNVTEFVKFHTAIGTYKFIGNAEDMKKATAD